ncbi:MAG: hypothetical protein QOI66_2354 [Myxococcales bacterium]|nr:hypothetical protein [Myxococcales bacterium]
MAPPAPMPHLLFDKSAFQAIGGEMHAVVRNQYNVVTAGTLLYEVAGDLRQDRSFRTKTPEQHAATLAKKFGGPVNEHRDWRDICRRELSGENIRLDEGPIIQNEVEAILPGGARVYLDVKLEDGSIVSPTTHWIERLATETWNTRYPADNRTLESGVKALWGILAARIGPSKVRLIDETAVVAEVDRILNDDSLKEILVRWTADIANDKRNPRRVLRDSVKRRWSTLHKPKLMTFAPYAYHCARVQLLYLVGYNVWPKGRERNDLADLDYVRLLPFVDVFVSNDKFVRALASHVVRPNQELISSSELKNRLDPRGPGGV